MTAEDVQTAIKWVDDHMPRLAPRLKELNQKDPEAIKRIVQRMRGRIAEIEKLAQENPQAAKVRIDEWQAGMRVVDASRTLRDRVRSKAPAAELEKARADVRAALVDQFDAQIKLQETDLVDMKGKIEGLQKRLDERRAGRDKWLEERLKDIENGHDRHGPPPSGGSGDRPPPGERK